MKESTRKQKKTRFLTEFEFCYLTNTLSGNVTLLEGPCRIGWKPFNQLSNVMSKITLKEAEFTIILNPYNAERENIDAGAREVRIGPCRFSLYPGEEIENNRIQSEYILDNLSGLLIESLRDFDDDGTHRKAGVRWMIKGPCRFVPNKYMRVIRKISTLCLGENEGIYIKNSDSGSVRLVRGPCSYFLRANEEFYQKVYSESEIIALKMKRGGSDLSRAIPLHLAERDVILIISGDKQRVETGPKVVLLEPYERLKICTISGSTPKVPDRHKIYKIFCGSVFVSDQLCVRTKDNAELNITLRYKTRFDLDASNLLKIFAVEDFIGYATETLAGLIRQEVAFHDFEDFHSNAGELISNRILSEEGSTFTFKENGYQIFGIDIKKIIPFDPAIATQLNDAIKSNMEIFVQKMHQSAELEAERQLVAGKTEIEETRKALIELQQENTRLERLLAAEVEAETILTIAKAESEATRLKESEKNKMIEERMKNTLNLLKETTSEDYIRLKQVESFTNIDKTIIMPSDSKLFVPLGQLEGKNLDNLDPDEI